MPILMYDPELNTALQHGYRCAARKARTIGQDLSPSLYLDRPQNKPTWLSYKGSYPCGHKKCIFCMVMVMTQEIISPVNNYTYRIKQYINCNSKGMFMLFPVVYVPYYM